MTGEPKRRFQSILLPVREAETAVGEFRRDGDWSSAHGIPPHITIAGSWPLDVNLPTDALGHLAEGIRRTRFALSTVGALGDAVCVFLADESELLRLRSAILGAVGCADTVDHSWRLHLTVCRPAKPESREAIEAAIAKALPIPCEAQGLLIVQMLDDSGVTMREL